MAQRHNGRVPASNMYREFFDLPQNPFSNTPDPAFLFSSPGHKATLQALLSSIEAAQGCVALVGEAGVGKTLLLRAVLEHIDHRQYKAIWVLYPALSFPEMLQTICQASGLDSAIDDPVAVVRHLQQAWLEEHKRGRKVVLIIDEAHNIPVQTLEGLLRLASPSVFTGTSLIHIVFAGLPEFWQRLHSYASRYFKKQCITCLHLSPLTRRESMDYIRHRVRKVAASADALFTQKALQQVVYDARGNPGMLNTLCSNMLITSRLYHQKLVSTEIAHEVLAAYRKRRSHAGLRRGVAYAAGVLLAVSLVGGVQYGPSVVSLRGSLELSRLAQPVLLPWSAHRASQPIDVAVPILQPESTVPFVQPEPTVSSVYVATVPESPMPSMPLAPAPFAPQLPEQVAPQSVEVVATQLALASFAPQSPDQVVSCAVSQGNGSTVVPEPPGALPVTAAPVAPPDTVLAAESPGARDARGITLASQSLRTREETPARDREIIQGRPHSAMPVLPPLHSGVPSFAGSSRLVVEAEGHAAMIR